MKKEMKSKMIKAEKLAAILNVKNDGEIVYYTRIVNKVIGEFTIEINDRMREKAVDLTHEILSEYIGRIDKDSGLMWTKIKHVILNEIVENLLI